GGRRARRRTTGTTADEGKDRERSTTRRRASSATRGASFALVARLDQNAEEELVVVLRAVGRAQRHAPPAADRVADLAPARRLQRQADPVVLVGLAVDPHRRHLVIDQRERPFLADGQRLAGGAHLAETGPVRLAPPHRLGDAVDLVVDVLVPFRR